MSFSFQDFAGALKAGTPTSAEDVLAARRWAWSDGGISPAEAETIFELNHLTRDASPEWIDFFVEALNEYIVNRQAPRGYVDDANARWLMAQIDRDGRVETAGELELLVKVLESALNAPETLKAYALAQIERVVLTGEGPTRRGGALRPGVIDEAEVALLCRLLFAGGGEGGVTISRDEAELLWRLKEATLGADNAPGWAIFFVQALGNHLMAYSAYRPLARAEAQRLEAFVGDHRSSVGGFLARMFGSIGERAPEKRKDRDYWAEAAAEAVVTPAETAWLDQHVKADGALDPLEKALLVFVKDERRSAA